jgi:hypothetical protein
MPDYDQSANSQNDYNSMQAQVGLIPPFAAAPPPMLFPGQVSAMMAQGGVGAAFAQMRPAYTGGPPQMGGNMWGGGGGNQGPMGNAGFGSGMFPTQQYPTFTTGPSLTQFPSGVMMPNQPGAPYNPYAGIGAPPGGYGGSLYGPSAGYAPPAYAGLQGQGFPFAPHPPSPMFNTPYAGGLAQQEATQDRMFAGSMTGIGLGARVGANLMGGLAGASIGGRIGGGWGAAIGLGAGIMGSEQLGVGRFAQNAMMDYGLSPAINMRGYGAGIEHMSQGFVSGGPFLHDSGAGFSRDASTHSARLLQDMAGSSGFRRETQDRFNVSDVMRITQSAGQTGMMEGVQSPEQMRNRVREVARSLSAFMELAQEPDLQRAISTMGQLRASGLNLNETMTAVRNGRTFARMAGMTFEGMASTGGAMGGQTYQAMGLGQGLGFQVGMGNLAQAQTAANQGRVGPTLMGLMGGSQGYANLNNAFSASFMQMPMLAPAMMGSGGGLNTNSLQNLMSGQSNVFNMAGQGANALTGMTRRFGVEGLGAAVAMQPFLQTQIGQLIESQGPFARRNMEDNQVFQMMKQMGMRGSAGFMTVAQTMGMSREQAMARAQEMNSPGYFDNMRKQIDVQRREARAEELRRNEENRPGVLDTLSGTFDSVAGARRGIGRISRGIGDIYEGLAHGQSFQSWSPQTDSERRQYNRFLRSDSFRSRQHEMDSMAQSMGGTGSLGESFDAYRSIAEARGGRGIASALAAPILGMQMSTRERDAALRDIQGGGSMMQAGMNSSAMDEIRASRRLNQALGGQMSHDIQGDMALRMSQMFNTGGPGGMSAGMGMGVNAAFRAGVRGITRDFIDPGNIVGGRAPGISEMRGQLTQALEGRGMGHDRATQVANDQLRNVMTSSGSLMRLMMTPQQEAAARDAIGAGQRAQAPGGGSLESAQAMELRGARALLGGEGADLGARGQRMRDQIAGYFRASQGVGTEGSRKQELSQRYVAMMMMLSDVIHDPNAGSERIQQAQQRLHQLHEQMKRDGFSDREMLNMRQEADRHVHSGQVTEGHREAARQFVDSTKDARTATDLLNRAKEGRESTMAGRAQRNMLEGAEQMARGHGVMSQVFQGFDARHGTAEDVTNRLMGMSEDQLRELGKETGGAQMAQRIRAAKAGNRGAMAQVLGGDLGGPGEARARARQEYENTRKGMWNTFRNMFTSGVSAFESEGDYLDRTVGGGTAADARAEGQQRGVNNLESEARNSGMGGASDVLLTAAQELRRAAELFTGAAQTHQMDNLIGGNNGN